MPLTSRNAKGFTALSIAVGSVALCGAPATALMTFNANPGAEPTAWPNDQFGPANVLNNAPLITSNPGNVAGADGNPTTSATVETVSPGKVEAETFTAPSNFHLGGIAFSMDGSGDPGFNDVSLHLFRLSQFTTGASTGYLLGGQTGSSSDPNAAEVGPDLLGGGNGDSFTFNGLGTHDVGEFDFSGADQVALVAGVTYTLEIWDNGSGPNIYMDRTGDQPYSGGQVLQATGNGAEQDFSSQVRGQVTNVSADLDFAVYPATIIDIWGDFTGSFSNGADWSTGSPPNAAGVQAGFEGATVNRTVTVDEPATLGSVTFTSATNGVGYNIIGTNTLTLNNAGTTSVLTLTNGTDTIAAPIAITSSVDAIVPASSTLTLSGTWTLNNATATLQKDGAGVLNMTKVSSAALTINAGTLAVIEGTGGGSLGAIHAPTSGTLGTSVVNGTVTLASTATLDLTTHAMVINYNGEAWATQNYEGIPSPIGELTFGKHTPTQSYPAGSITRYVQTASDGGNWDLPGITSSVAENDVTGTTAVGVIDQNDLFALQGNDYTTANGGPGTWEGVPVANDNNVLVRYTYYGDTNLDGHVDGTDVDNLIQGFEGFGDGWLYGDFNYDGIVNGQDVTELIIGFSGQKGSMGDGGISPGQAQFLLSLATGITSAQVAKFDAIVGVPEPTTIGLLGVAALGLIGRRRR